MMYNGELVTREKNFHTNVLIDNSKCDVIMCNLSLHLDFVIREFGIT